MPETWLAAAEELADGIREHGYAAAALVASAWRAGVDPDATRSLLGAASVLTGGDAVSRAWDRVPPCVSAGQFLGGAEEIEGETAGAFRFAQRMAGDCAGTLDAAAEGYEQARQAADAAAAAGDGDAEAAARDQAGWLQAVIGDCEAALEVIGAAAETLREAALLLLRVPADFEETYEEPLRFAASGRKLPRDGGFITPGTAETIPARGAA